MNITLMIALLAVVLAIVLLRIRSSKKHRVLMQELHDFAKENDCQIMESECWKGLHTVTKIGLDTNRLKLFFIRSVKGSSCSFYVDITELKGVTKYCSNRFMGEGREQGTLIDVVGLTLSYKNNKRKDEFLEFFNCDFDRFRVDGEIQLAEKWEDSISQLINL